MNSSTVRIATRQPGEKAVSRRHKFASREVLLTCLGVKQLCSVGYGIEYSKLYSERSFKRAGVKWREPDFQLRIGFDSAHIKFSVFYLDESVAYTEAKYKEDST